MSNPFAQNMVRMKAPPGVGPSVSARGFTVDADADGIVTVPGDVAAELTSHGFTKAPDLAPGKKQ